MILGVHAIAGATLALTFRENIFLAGISALLSHFLLDTIPHWHYELKSLDKNAKDPLREKIVYKKEFARDLLVMGAECIAGFIISILLAPKFVYIAILGAFFGVLPDFLQFIYHLYPKTPMLQIHAFHKWIHTKIRLDDKPLWGIPFQLSIALAFAGLLRYLAQ